MTPSLPSGGESAWKGADKPIDVLMGGAKSHQTDPPYAASQGTETSANLNVLF